MRGPTVHRCCKCCAIPLGRSSTGPLPPLTLPAVVRGSGWVALDNAEPMWLAERDVAVVRGPVPIRIANSLFTPAQLVVEGTLFIRTLRTWFGQPGGAAPSWFRTLEDPVTGAAPKRFHERPDHPWTVAALAAAPGVSRAGLARRFKERLHRRPRSAGRCSRRRSPW
ncbi:cupin domain-containing protein [Streptomyces sp. NPDC001530]|uniref:cupin domain-containing protein n=1 Tax=Streptomyces sp. NPDC001530 TaxID=3364582 RepID=UPI0036A80ADA